MSPWLSDRLLGSQSDERLAALACAGSDRAFAAIVQRYRRPLYAFARRLDANGDAEDLVQQTFLSALAAMRSGGEVRHLRGWLHQILRHAAIQASKGAALAEELEHADLATPSAHQAAELRMLTAEALAALAQLPARQYEAMVATAVQGRSRAEVAALLGVTEGAVRQLVHRAREALRTAVTAITPYPLAQALAAGPSGGGLADVAAGAGAGSAGALVVKLGAVLASGLVATGIVASSVRGPSHSTQGAHRHSAISAVTASDPPGHGVSGTRLAAVRGGSSAANRLLGGESGRGRGGGAASTLDGSNSGPGSGSDGSGSGSSDGGSIQSSSSGGPSVTTASSSDGSGGGGSTTTTTTTSGSGGGSGRGGPGPSDGGQTTTTATTTTSSSSDGGGSGGSGSGDITTTTTTSSH